MTLTTPEQGAAIAGISKTNGRVRPLLDIDRIPSTGQTLELTRR